MQQIHEDKNKPTGKEIQVRLTKVTWPYCSKENGQKKKKYIYINKNVHLMTESNTNQPKQIKCKTWLNKWFSQFQQVSVHGPDCSRSRGDGGTEEQDRCLFFWILFGIRSDIPPTPSLWWDALMPWRPRELWRECPNVWRPWVLHFNTSIGKGFCD